ncbi:low-temperature viability protein ltv1-related [Anaeramoeba flamelloides]|uniref:Low-temperature viability protein ltv1-related n=1 Tax=Anaeramoeba flamelloides TaxID=1746091 RepID=A0ABQ8Z4Q5_9EUKA|nr:low-temperature viability protein ltv1-related [Anaeramoeba flamelloides]
MSNKKKNVLKNKKRKKGVTFQLLHRSKRDPLNLDNESSERVLVPVSTGKKKKINKKEKEINEYIKHNLPNDGYDYSKHFYTQSVDHSEFDFIPSKKNKHSDYTSNYGFNDYDYNDYYEEDEEDEYFKQIQTNNKKGNKKEKQQQKENKKETQKENKKEKQIEKEKENEIEVKEIEIELEIDPENEKQKEQVISEIPKDVLPSVQEFTKEEYFRIQKQQLEKVDYYIDEDLKKEFEFEEGFEFEDGNEIGDLEDNFISLALGEELEVPKELMGEDLNSQDEQNKGQEKNISQLQLKRGLHYWDGIDVKEGKTLEQLGEEDPNKKMFENVNDEEKKKNEEFESESESGDEYVDLDDIDQIVPYLSKEIGSQSFQLEGEQIDDEDFDKFYEKNYTEKKPSKTVNELLNSSDLESDLEFSTDSERESRQDISAFRPALNEFMETYQKDSNELDKIDPVDQDLINFTIKSHEIKQKEQEKNPQISIEQELLQEEMRKNRKPDWDCESILSTRQNTNNQAKTIQLKGKSKKQNNNKDNQQRDGNKSGLLTDQYDLIQISKKTGIPRGVLNEKQKKQKFKKQNLGKSRKGESKEERKERKKKIKEMKKLRKAKKKQTKKKFQNEEKKQKIDQIKQRQNNPKIIKF